MEKEQGMEEVARPTTPGRRRRVVVGGATVAAAFVVLGSVAWACTQRVGTMISCRPPSATYVNGTQCGKITGTSQTGSPSVVKAGSQFSVRAINFYAKPYNVTWRKVGSTANCHTIQTGVTQLTSVAPVLTGSQPAGRTSFMGPNFQAEFKSPVETATGQAKVCVQDTPDRVSAQIINFAVL